MEIDNLLNKYFPTNNCGEIFVFEKIKFNDKKSFYKCRFLEYPYEVLALKQNILKGQVANPMYPSIYNKGFIGVGKYNSSNISYLIWKHILSRCYNLKDNIYNNYGAQGTNVCEEWFNFQNFATWYEEQSKLDINCPLEIDKDILANINHSKIKEYSPDTCLLIPNGLNSFLAGDNLKSGIIKRNNKYQVKISRNKIQIYLGTFDTFEEAKQIYAKKKYEFWLEEINKFNLPIELKNILSKYKFYINQF